MSGNTLEYALAKELMTKGWPQPNVGMIEAGIGKWVINNPYDDPSLHIQGEPYDTTITPIYSPSLSELIAACPKTMPVGWGNTGRFLLGYFNTEEWTASYSGTYLCRDGNTPEEAVARLWLALLEKENEHG